MWKTRLVVLAAIVLLPGVLMFPVWRLAGLGAGEDDVLYYFPMRAFFHEAVTARHWPWFNPWTGLGRPYAADPQTAIWYPPTWLFAALPPIHAYPLSLWLHVVLALWGMYRLLRAGTLDCRAALFGGIAFAFCGFLLAHRAHFSMQHAAAWAPWVIWRLQRFAVAGETARAGRLPAAVAVLALQCLAGHVQMVALTVIAALVLIFAGPRAATRTKQKRRLQIELPLARWLVACLLALGVFAVQWVPSLLYLRLCTRVDRTYSDFIENSWHPASAVGWLLPMLYGQRTPNFFDQPYWGPSHQVEQFSYAGWLSLLLAAAALRGGWRGDPRRRPWVLLAAFGVLLALGEFGPVCPLLYWIPGSRVFRCPARALLLVNLALAALAAATFDDLGGKLSAPRARLRAILLRWTSRPVMTPLFLVAVMLVGVLLAVPFLPADVRAAALRALRPWNSAVWVPATTGVVSFAVLRFVVQRWRRPQQLWILPALLAADLGVIGWTIDVPTGTRRPEDLLMPPATAEWVDPLRDSARRLWVLTQRQGWTPGEYINPTTKLVANVNILHGISALTDYGPLQPRAFVERYGFKPWGEPTKADELLADTRWTRLANVGWILLCDSTSPEPADAELVDAPEPGWRLYSCAGAAGWAMFENAAQPGAVVSSFDGPNALIVQVDTWPTEAPATRRGTAGAGAERLRLLISFLHLPGWTARVNGEPGAIEPAPLGLMAVGVPVGQASDVELRYVPPGLSAGATISVATLAAMFVYALWGGRVGWPLRRL